MNAIQPSLLAGLLFDDQGNAMSPSHASKKTRRYRYYVSQALLHYRASAGGSVIRVATGEIEHPAIDAILDLLQSPKQLILLFNASIKDAFAQQALIKKAQVLASNWKTNAPSQHIQRLQQFIEKITVSQTRVVIELTLVGLGRLLGVDLLNNETHHIEIPIQLRRCGMEMKIILPTHEDQAIDPLTLAAIQQGVTQALLWNEQLLNGQVTSIQEIATKEHLDRSYVTRRLRLAFLAPDIIVSIFEGHLPPQLTMTTLRNGFPLDWKQQRKHLGFNEIQAPNVTRQFSI